MRIMYFDCGMGAAGDMLTGALLELIPDKDGFINKLNNLGIPGVKYETSIVNKCGINGTHVTVLAHGKTEEAEHDHSHEEHCHDDHEEHGHEHNHHHHEEINHDHHHSGMHDIEHIVRGHLNVSDRVKDDIMSVYNIIAEAESRVHGVAVDEIHFHEVGNMDAIADVTAVCMLIDEIKPDRIIATPVHVGSGQVKCAHGIMPVPAPATALILKDVPMYGGSIKGELCTPTGAALLKYFVSEYGDMPAMKTEAIGYGMGNKDFERANCVRIFLGNDVNKSGKDKNVMSISEGCGLNSKNENNTITELSCNIDDMTGEALGYAMDVLMKEGALDTYTTAIGMKKNRPGILLTVLCRNEDRNKMVEAVFKHTTTIGIRENLFRRYTLARHEETVNTEYGEVRRKVSSGYGVVREKYEYEDISSIAERNKISIQDVINKIN